MKSHILASVLFLFLFNSSVTNTCHDHEREALLSFKSYLTDPSNLLSSWQANNCCDWHGIYCSNSLHVIKVDLRNPHPSSFVINMNSELFSTSDSVSTALNGTISSSLFTLKYMDHLDLSFNNFMFSKIPNAFTNLTKLAYLNLSNAMFSGSITTQFANLTSLRTLDLSCSSSVRDYSTYSYHVSSSPRINAGSLFTYIKGGDVFSSDLNWLRGLHNLTDLILTGVDLSKPSQLTQWAEPISMLPNLKLLHLSNCTILGKIPVDELLNLSQLHSLSMDFNSLTSQIPSQLANLTSLLDLDLSSTNLQGPIPYLPQLNSLYVGGNLGLVIDLNSMFAVPWGQLESLGIESTQVTGSIPASFGNTTSLIRFIAHNCSIQGPLPSSFTNLTGLEIVTLDYNNITSHLSPSISGLKALQYLSLMQNSLEGSIPNSICNISSLQYLNLFDNSLSGILPDCIYQLPNLRHLLITSNDMNGTIPSSLFQNSSIDELFLGDSGFIVKVDQYTFPTKFQPQFLDLSSCRLGGSIPDFIANLTRLVVLGLANNNLTGTIPSWMFNLPQLGFLDLSFNSLEGVLPSNIQLKPYFGPTILNLAGNLLQGHIPLIENVEVINLSWNNFTGYIPTQKGSENIKYLSLSGNNIFGQIPLSFCHVNNVLKLLDLSGNSLSGTVPTSLGNCTSLIFLNLGRNNLSGNIPNELEGAKNLRLLNLSDNHFDGLFPTSIKKLDNLEVLNLGNNRFEGRIPQFIGELQNLYILVLELNSFNESIPQEIYKLKKLQFMLLSNNKLSGSIPEGLYDLEMLRSRPTDGNIRAYMITLMYAGVELNWVTKGFSYQLVTVKTFHSGIDLSHNALTGNIPAEIGLLHGLAMLNLSHNHLSGEIPKSIGNMRGLESLDLSSNNLSGEIPTTINWLDSLGYLNLSFNNLSGRIPQGTRFDTLYNDGLPYIGNNFLCGVPGGMSCNNSSGPSGQETGRDNVDDTRGRDNVDDTRQKWLFYGTVILGYGFGFWGFFGVLYLMKEEWRKRYWRAIDKIALRIIRFL